MPELPDLQVVQEYLSRELPGARITAVEARRPWLLRDLTGKQGAALVGRAVRSVARRGKFLAIAVEGDLFLVINPKLAGRLALYPLPEKLAASVALVVAFEDGRALTYADTKDMGQVYVVPMPEKVPGYDEQGPDALDPSLSLDLFLTRLRSFRGEIKGVLTRPEFVAGIGNAYADEILFAARISPFRKCTSLTAEERERLYHATRQTLQDAVATLRERVGNHIEVEVRDFLQVHNRGGQPCPRCGHTLSQLTARQRITSFCRHCQPGTLVRN